MSKRIFRSVLLVALLVFLTTLMLTVGVLYNYFSDVLMSQLRNETELTARGVENGGVGYLDTLERGDYRITWVGADGTVLYDSSSRSDAMENHLQRQEVREAMEKGYGESVRYSTTTAIKLLYAARRLSDGTVLRMSISQYSPLRLVVGTWQPLLVLFAMAVLLSFVLARWLSGKIVKPLLQMDINEPVPEKGYEEIAPLLQRLRTQQLQLREDQVALNKTEEIRREFTANVSHELKTPLHTISGYAELIKDGLVRQEDIRPFAGKIYSEAYRMTQLVDDIIELSRLDEGAADTERQDCDLAQIAGNAADALSTVATEKNVTLLCLHKSSVPMVGVPQLLYGIVYNLCDNAIKYNHPGGSVTVTVENRGDQVLLRVQDTGIGIPEEHQDRVFERFYRVDKSHSKDMGGTGLGLSIVKHAVFIHGGKIQLESTPGVGTAITVTVPRGERGAGNILH